jgi:hypothetical protein
MKLLMLIPVILLSACSRQNVERKKTKYVIKDGESSLEILTIDGCEYLYGTLGNMTFLTHKGNCLYCKNK